MRFHVASRERSAAFRSRVLSLAKALLDRVEVGTIGRQKEQLGASSTDGTPDGLSLVTAEIVDDDNVARLERWHQELFDIGQEAFAVDRSVDHAGISAARKVSVRHRP